MTLTKTVEFEVVLQKCNLFQVPKIIRWQFKLEPDQVLKVDVRSKDLYASGSFLAKMSKDGRIRVPKLFYLILKGKEPDLVGRVIEVKLQPAAT
jgi:hypothetical protein